MNGKGSKMKTITDKTLYWASAEWSMGVNRGTPFETKQQARDEAKELKNAGWKHVTLTSIQTIVIQETFK